MSNKKIITNFDKIMFIKNFIFGSYYEEIFKPIVINTFINLLN